MLVACVGNVLRGDDGFGVAVARRLAEGGGVPGADLIETGIGGMSLVQRLMDGYSALVLVDAVDQDAAPGTLFVLEPDPPVLDAALGDTHLADPARVLALADAIGVLPDRVRIVGCQPDPRYDPGDRLSASVAGALEGAAALVRRLAADLAPDASPCAGTAPWHT